MKQKIYSKEKEEIKKEEIKLLKDKSKLNFRIANSKLNKSKKVLGKLFSLEEDLDKQISNLHKKEDKLSNNIAEVKKDLKNFENQKKRVKSSIKKMDKKIKIESLRVLQLSPLIKKKSKNKK